jgi:ABC-2 type transport system permease protein
MENANVNNRKRLPSDVSQIIIVAKYDMLKHLRSKRLLGLLIIEALMLVLMFALPIVLDANTSDDPAQYMSNYIGWVGTLIILGATMFAGDAIVSEFQSRTGYLLFPNPVKRSVIFIGKYLSTLVIVSIMLVIFYGVAAVLTLAMTGGSTVLWVYSLLFALCYGAAAAALGVFISTVFKGSTGSLVLTFFMLMMILPMVMFAFIVGNIDIVYILTSAEYVVSGLMSSPYPSGDMYPDVWASLGILAVYAVACLSMGLVIFKRREMVS